MNNAFIHGWLRALILVLVFQCVYVSIEIVDEIRPHDSGEALQTTGNPLPTAEPEQAPGAREVVSQELSAQELISTVCADDHEQASHEAGADTCDHCCHCHGHGSHLAVLVNNLALPLAPEPAQAGRQTTHFTSAPTNGIYRPPIA